MLRDMHAHVGDNDGLLNLAAGVTTVRDLGNDADLLLARRKRIEEGARSWERALSSPVNNGRSRPFPRSRKQGPRVH